MTFMSSSIHAAFFHEHNYCLRFLKVWSFILVSSKLTEVLQNLYKFQFFTEIKTVLMSSLSIFKLQERQIDHFNENSSYIQPRFFLSFPCIKYQKSKTTFKLYLNFHVYQDTLYYVYPDPLIKSHIECIGSVHTAQLLCLMFIGLY